MHTEETARKLWCPFVRMAALASDSVGNATPTELPSFNRMGQANAKDETFRMLSTDGCRCIASDCMAWRWTDTIDEAIERCAMAENTNPYNPQDSELRERGLSYRRGLCGLARDQP